MLERDLQDYLFDNPDVLFPGQIVQEKSREFYVQGRRIDLLFRVDGLRYIVELKRATIEREHIGQVIEYYGLMRESIEAADLRMILVAPSIPSYRKHFLEEIGIRCVEIQSLPRSDSERNLVKKASSAQLGKERAELELTESLSGLTSIRFEEITAPATSRALAISHLALKDSLQQIPRDFSEYDIDPVKTNNVVGVLCAKDPE
jgi:hypothetical protein